MTTQPRGAAPALLEWLDQNLITASPVSLEQLEEIVTDVGRSPWHWGQAVTFDVERRSHHVLYRSDSLEIALFGWATGQDTLYHDHGGASGAAFVCSGTLIEDVVEAVDGLAIRRPTYTRPAGSAFSFGADYIHRVRHDPVRGLALSIHAYSPAVSNARDYDVRVDGTIRVLEPIS